jgi:hypothetical protein
MAQGRFRVEGEKLDQLAARARGNNDTLVLEALGEVSKELRAQAARQNKEASHKAPRPSHKIPKANQGKIAATTGVSVAGAKEALDWLWTTGFPPYHYPIEHQFLALPIIDGAIMAMLVMLGTWIARGRQ